MTEEQQFKLQAFLDGELPSGEAEQFAEWLSRDADAGELRVELQNTRRALDGFEADVRLPESREFYWSRIQREIARIDKPAPARSVVAVLAAWRRFLVPAGAIAGLALAVMLALPHFNVAATPEIDLALADSDAFTYRDYADGMTLVWLSYPAENDFSGADSFDTLD